VFEFDFVLVVLWETSGIVVVKHFCYKPEGRGFDNFFSVHVILPAAPDPGVYSVSDRNVYQEQENNVSGE
jgi:hypothetical protein